MQIEIIPTRIKGTLMAPASKSVMQRACAAALLRSGETLIHNYGKSEDDQAALRIIQQLGATVEYINEQTLKISSDGKVKVTPGTELDCGESGLSLRMFSPIASLAQEEISISGKGSLLQRPVRFFEEILPQLGVRMQLAAGKLPLWLKGPLQPKNIVVDGSLTSQLLSGLLLAYSAHQESAGCSINVRELKSKAYIDLTLNVMKDFKMRLPVYDQYDQFSFGPVVENNPASGGLSYTVEADWSNAAFLLVAGAIAGSITVKGLDVFSAQADKKILEALQDCGCRLSIQAGRIEVSHQLLKAFHFDATGCPDLFPPLVALAACCPGVTVLEGVHRLVHKESNRALTLQQEFAKLGIEITLQEDKMIIRGGMKILSTTVNSHNDHRIAMACAVIALRAQGTVNIEAASAVAKSYPAFWTHMAEMTGQALLSRER